MFLQPIRAIEICPWTCNAFGRMHYEEYSLYNIPHNIPHNPPPDCITSSSYIWSRRRAGRLRLVEWENGPDAYSGHGTAHLLKSSRRSSGLVIQGTRHSCGNEGLRRVLRKSERKCRHCWFRRGFALILEGSHCGYIAYRLWRRVSSVRVSHRDCWYRQSRMVS